MPSVKIPRPQSDEHAEFYAKYIERVPEGDLVSLLREQVLETVTLLQNLSPSQADYAYAPDKWTIKQVIGHIIDAERVFLYRALRFARKDPTELAGFDENTWVRNATFPTRVLSDLLDELQLVRASTVHFAKNLSAEELASRGTANGKVVSVRALLYIAAGHERHHVALLRERYLSQLT